MTYHPNDADRRLSALMEDRTVQEHADWFSTLTLEQQIAWLREAGRDAAEALSRITGCPR